MKRIILFLSVIAFGLPGSLSAQIEVSEETLPEVGDVLRYANFTPDDTMSHTMDGAGLTWSYGVSVIDSFNEENYRDIQGTPLADSFPNANMIVEGLGSMAAARRTANEIEILGFGDGPFGPFGGGVTRFNDPFLIRRVPINYGDVWSDSVRFAFTFSSDLIPGLDTVMPVPGATIDSIRIRVTLKRTERASAWGTLTAQGQDFDVLKITADDEVRNGIDLGLLIGGFRVWFDATTLFGDVFGGNNLSTNYRFQSADSKESIMEILEQQVPIDTMGNTRTVYVGRIKGSLVTSVHDLAEIDGIKLSPNPVSDRLAVTADDDLSNAEYRLTSLDGRLLRQGNFNRDIDVSWLPTGQYMVHIVTEAAGSVLKFVKE